MSFSSFGFQTQEIQDGEFVSVEDEDDYADDIDDDYDDSEIDD